MKFPRSTFLGIALLAGAAAMPTWAADATPVSEGTAESAGAPSAELRLARTVELPAGTTIEKAKAAVLLSLGRYRWLVHLVETDCVIAFYARQPVMVALTVKLLPGRIEFWTRGVGPVEKLQAKENQWLNNLILDTNVALGLAVPPVAAAAGK